MYITATGRFQWSILFSLEVQSSYVSIWSSSMQPSQVIEWKVILLIPEIEYEYESNPCSLLLAERYCTSTVLPANLETKVCVRLFWARRFRLTPPCSPAPHTHSRHWRINGLSLCPHLYDRASTEAKLLAWGHWLSSPASSLASAQQPQQCTVGGH